MDGCRSPNSRMYVKKTPGSFTSIDDVSRWSCQDRFDRFRRVAKCSIRQHWAARHSQSCTRDIRTAVEHESPVPSVAPHWRTHTSYRPGYQVRQVNLVTIQLTEPSPTEVSRSFYKPYSFVSYQRLWKYHWSAEFWYVDRLSISAHYAHVSKDIQIRLGLCCYHGRDNGCIHLVYHPNDVLAVRRSICISNLRVLMFIVAHDFV